MDANVKKWGEMDDIEREDFLNNLNRIDQNNTRKYKRHIQNVGGLTELADIDGGEIAPVRNYGDSLLSALYRGTIPVEINKPGQK